MPATSQNGYPANDKSLTDVYIVPGSEVRLRLRKGPCARVLLEVAAWVDRFVEDIDTRAGVKGFDVPDDWSYAERPIRGGTSLSNHASGTAVDLNAVQHPLGVRGTWSDDERRQINSYLRREWTDPATSRVVVRWGDNYISRADGMHFEIDADETAVARALAAWTDRRRPQPAPGTVPPFPLAAGEYFGPQDGPGGAISGFSQPGGHPGIRTAQKQLRARGWTITVDGLYGPQMTAVITAFQREKHLPDDGLLGARTWPALWTAPVTR